MAWKLRELGCEQRPRRGRGSHRLWHNPTTGDSATVPDWGSKDLRIGTIRAAVRQLGLDWDSFQQA